MGINISAIVLPKDPNDLEYNIYETGYQNLSQIDESNIQKIQITINQ